jgi:hypothetical protein
MWVRTFDDDPAGTTDPYFVRQSIPQSGLFGKASTTTLSEVTTAHVAIVRAGHRVGALTFSLPPWDETATDDGREVKLQIIEDRFDLMPDGGARPHDRGDS